MNWYANDPHDRQDQSSGKCIGSCGSQAKRVGAVILVCAKKDIRPDQSFKRQLELMIVRISLELRSCAAIGRTSLITSCDNFNNFNQ